MPRHRGLELEHALECHDRWMERRSRKTEAADYQEGWSSQQCGGCSYFIPLMGQLSEDWGACTNTRSPFDKTVMFEHDGCQCFEDAGEFGGWNSTERQHDETVTASVARDEFLCDPATVLRRAQTEGPIVIVDSSGKPTAIVSAPRDEPASIR
jgi:DUF3027 family protein